MAKYDFGDSATPVVETKGKSKYDFGDSATPVKNGKVAPEESMLSKASTLFGPGLGEAALNAASGLIAKPVSEVAGLAATAKEMVSPTPGATGEEPEKFKRNVQKAMTYEPKTDLGKFASKYNPLALAGNAVNYVGDKVGGAIKGDASNDSLRGMAGNAVGETVKQAPAFLGAKGEIGAVVDNIPKNIKLSPEMTAVNKSAKKIGVELQPHQLTENKFGKIAGAEMAKVPLSGSKDAANKGKWNQALAKEIGGDAKDGMLTPSVYDRAIRQSGAVIGRITGKYSLKLDKDLLDKIEDIKKETSKETSDNARVINGMIEELQSKAKGGSAPTSKILGPDGAPLPATTPATAAMVEGVTFRKFNTALSKKIAKTTDGDLRYALSDLQDALLEQFNSGITNKVDVAALKSARMQYAKAKDIAGIVGDAKGVNPQALRQQIRNTKFKKDLYARGNSSLKDLADVGDLLRDPNSSLTAERNLLYKVAGAAGGTGAAAAVAPVATGAGVAGLYGAANLYNRFGNRLLPDSVPPIPPKGPRKPGFIDYAAIPRLPQDNDRK